MRHEYEDFNVRDEEEVEEVGKEEEIGEDEVEDEEVEADTNWTEEEETL